MARDLGSSGSMTRTLYASYFITHVNSVPRGALEEALTEIVKVPDNTCKDFGTGHGMKRERLECLLDTA